jgi:hypothetical protein
MVVLSADAHGHTSRDLIAISSPLPSLFSLSLSIDISAQLARAGSAAVKELVEATYQLQDREHFVAAVKSTLQAITPFVGAPSPSPSPSSRP